MTLSPRRLARLLRDDDRSVRDAVRDAGGTRAVLAVAREQGVGGLAVDRLRAAGALSPVEDARERVRDVEAGLWLDRAAAALARVTHALDAARVRAVSLKGPALAERLYPEAPQHRLSIDLDVLVARRDLPTAIAALSELGWTRDGGAWDHYLEAHHHAVHLSHDAQPTVDLHFLASAGAGVRLLAEPIVERARPFVLRGGTTVLVPCPEDELVYLAVHAVSHRLTRLVWLQDIARLLERERPDLVSTLARAREARAEGALRLVAIALARELGVTLDLPRGSPALRARVDLAALVARADATAPSLRDSALTFGVTTLTCDRPTDALVHAGGKVRRVVERLARYRARRGAPPA